MFSIWDDRKRFFVGNSIRRRRLVINSTHADGSSFPTEAWCLWDKDILANSPRSFDYSTGPTNFKLGSYARNISLVFLSILNSNIIICQSSYPLHHVHKFPSKGVIHDQLLYNIDTIYKLACSNININTNINISINSDPHAKHEDRRGPCSCSVGWPRGDVCKVAIPNCKSMGRDGINRSPAMQQGIYLQKQQ